VAHLGRSRLALLLSFSGVRTQTTMKRFLISPTSSLLFSLLLALTFMLAGALASGQPRIQSDKGATKKGPVSPREQTETTINGKKLTVEYSRPSMRGRKIVGDLIPYNKVWRTGADAATTFITETDLDIGGEKVPKGTYTLYTWPSESTWKLIINKQTGQWGLTYDQAQDLARIDMKKEALPKPIETFTIRFEPATNASRAKGGAVNLIMEWENTRLSVPIKEAK
jgi:DUF2911 family protein